MNNEIESMLVLMGIVFLLLILIYGTLPFWAEWLAGFFVKRKKQS